MTNVSFVRRCYETETRPITLEEVFDAIRTGGHGLKERVTQCQNRYEMELALTNDPEKAKKAIAELKNEFPGWLPSGTFSERANEKLVEYSALLMADLDDIGDAGPLLKDHFKAFPCVRAIATSPSGHGLKILFNVINDPARHLDSFRAIKAFVLEQAGFEVDEKCKDPARICFFGYDPELWVRVDGNEPITPADPLPRGSPLPNSATGLPNLTTREQIAFRLLGELKYDPGKGGYFVRCPSESLHSAKTAGKHTILYLTTVPTLKCQHNSCSAAVEAFNYVLRSEIGKAENVESRVSHIPLGKWETRRSTTNAENGSEEPGVQLIRVLSPKDLQIYVPPTDIQLIGDYHIVKDTGFVAVLGGPPGVGKSLTVLSLCVAGSIGEGDWFGMQVHRKFKVFVIQAEDGVFRLSKLFKDLNCEELQDFVRIIEPPTCGLAFRRDDFRKQLTDEIAAFAPDIVVIDPWNAAARDQEQRTYLDTFDIARSVLPVGTALLVVAHTRKPQSEERSTGRALMHILAGSHVLVSVPRVVFVLQYGSDDTEDDHVVWTCCKNNDGDLGKRTAWRRRSGLFLPAPNFDWETFDASEKDKRVVITEAMVKETFKDGSLLRVLARDKLRELSGASKSACYRALSEDGRFSDHLIFKEDTINYLTKPT